MLEDPVAAAADAFFIRTIHQRLGGDDYDTFKASLDRLREKAAHPMFWDFKKILPEFCAAVLRERSTLGSPTLDGTDTLILCEDVLMWAQGKITLEDDQHAKVIEALKGLGYK